MTITVPASRRQAIVERIRGGQSVVIAAHIQTEAELTFAIRWLLEHYVYKRTKSSFTGSFLQTIKEINEWNTLIDGTIAEAVNPVGGFGLVHTNPYNHLDDDSVWRHTTPVDTATALSQK